MALEAGVPVLPVAMIDTEKIQPPGRKMPDARHPGRHPDRQAAGLLPLRGHGGRPVRAALDHRRDHVRADGALRPGVRRHLRPGRQGPDQGRARPRRRAAEKRRGRAGDDGRPRRPGRADADGHRDARCGGRWPSSALLGAALRGRGVRPRGYDEYAHPVGGWVVLGADGRLDGGRLRCSTARPAGRTLAGPGARPGHRGGGGRAASRWLDDTDRIQAGAQTLPVVWAAAPVLAFAIRGGWPAGVGAALVARRGRPGAPRRAHRPTANNIVLLLLAGRRGRLRRDAGPPGRARAGPGAGGRRPRPGSASGCPARSTTACCRCWRWSVAAARRPAARPPSSAGWPPSRSRRCARWSAPRREAAAGEVDLRGAAGGVRLDAR